ncbi:MAG: cupin domain-containing protein [Candidatus Marinimicrobia bacterium]|nr:cupin domain-containing protein [Candidatus Neomarinimicrobiota bacterium]
MTEITVTHKPDPQTLKSRGIFDWPIWSKEISEFPWHYSEPETCYILEGDVIVTTKSGETARFGQGDLVEFPAGLTCRWKILKAVKKHYNFG